MPGECGIVPNGPVGSTVFECIVKALYNQGMTFNQGNQGMTCNVALAPTLTTATAIIPKLDPPFDSFFRQYVITVKTGNKKKLAFEGSMYSKSAIFLIF